RVLGGLIVRSVWWAGGCDSSPGSEQTACQHPERAWRRGPQRDEQSMQLHLVISKTYAGFEMRDTAAAERRGRDGGRKGQRKRRAEMPQPQPRHRLSAADRRGEQRVQQSLRCEEDEAR